MLRNFLGWYQLQTPDASISVAPLPPGGEQSNRSGLTWVQVWEMSHKQALLKGETGRHRKRDAKLVLFVSIKGEQNNIREIERRGVESKTREKSRILRAVGSNKHKIIYYVNRMLH